MGNVFDVLKERGFVQQTTGEDEIKKALGSRQVTFYIGFDPTANSLHVGNFMGMMLMSHLQKAGHRPIVLLGGGTAMVGDPSGKTDMRKMLTREQINQNAEKFKKQFSKFIDFSNNKAIMVNNADWLLELNYIDFLRDIGKHFSVNRMLTAECFKTRLERGLTFIEFNYMLMQSYDFLVLNKKYNCTMEMGGDDQWANILGGTDLVRRVESKEVYGLTFPLLVTSEGKKMGKTEKGALWLDAEKTSPYEFYQYWRNVNDADVEKCLALLTFLPMDEVRRLGALKDEKINEAKKVLAYEITKLIHSEAEAQKAAEAAAALFGGAGDMNNVPQVDIDSKEIENGVALTDLMVLSKLVPSKSEARRAIQQGGAYVNNNVINDVNHMITSKDVNDKYIMLRRGKKAFCKVVVK